MKENYSIVQTYYIRIHINIILIIISKMGCICQCLRYQKSKTNISIEGMDNETQKQLKIFQQFIDNQNQRNKGTLIDRQSAEKVNKSKYCFSYIEGQPDSLVMIKKTNQLLKLMYEVPIYIWVDVEKNNEMVKGFQQTLNEQLQQFQSVLAVKERINQVNSAFLICSYRIASQVCFAFSNQEKIKGAICFAGQTQQFFQSNRKYINVFKKIVKNKQQALDFVRFNRYHYFSEKLQTNLALISRGFWSYSILNASMILMLQLNKNREFYYDEMQKLVKIKWKYQTKQIDEFFQQARSGTLRPQDILRAYSKQPFLYCLVNILLRSGSHPTQFFLIQPIFKDLFLFIRDIYRKQKKQNGIHNLKFFRGGTISQSEVKNIKQNIGKIYQNQCFLSTSKKYNVALNMLNNVLFIIEVKQQKYDPQFDHGFADISKWAHHKDQEEVLFNPLNTFKIKCIHQKCAEQLGKHYYQITLLYGEIAKIMQIESELLSKQQQELKELVQISQKKDREGINQGQIFIRYLKGDRQYFQKFLDISKQCKKMYNILQSLKFLAYSYANEDNFQKALILLQNALTISQNILLLEKQLDREYLCDLLDFTGFCLIRMKNYSKALIPLKKSLEIQKNYKNTKNLSQALLHIGSIHEYMFNYDQASRCYIKYVKKIQKFYNYNHLNYVLALQSIGNLFYLQNNFSQSLEYLLKCQQHYEKFSDKLINNYRNVLGILSIIYAKRGQYEQANQIIKKWEKLFNFNEKIVQSDVKAIAQIAQACHFLRNSTKAIFYGENIINLKIMAIPTQINNYIVILGILCYHYNKMGDQQKVLFAFQKCTQILQFIKTKNELSNELILNSLGVCFLNMYYLKQAQIIFLKSLSIHYKRVGNYNLSSIQILQNLSLVYNFSENYQQSINIQLKIIQLKQKNYGHNCVQQVQNVLLLANIYRELGIFFSAIKMHQKNMKILSKFGLTTNINYARNLDRLAYTLNLMNKNLEALTNIKKSLKVYKKTIGQKNTQYAQALEVQGFIYFCLRNFGKSYQVYEKSRQIRKIIQGQAHIDYLQTIKKLNYVIDYELSQSFRFD